MASRRSQGSSETQTGSTPAECQSAAQPHRALPNNRLNPHRCLVVGSQCDGARGGPLCMASGDPPGSRQVRAATSAACADGRPAAMMRRVNRAQHAASGGEAWWRHVLFFGLLFLPGAVLLTFHMVGDAVSHATLSAILLAGGAVGVSVGFVFARHSVGKRRSRAGRGAASSATGCALALVVAFDGLIFILVLGAAAIALCSYLVTEAVLQLHHRGWARDEATQG